MGQRHRTNLAGCFVVSLAVASTGACLPSRPLPAVTAMATKPLLPTEVATPTAEPSPTAQPTPTTVLPTADPSLRLMFVTWVDGSGWPRPSDPPLAFADTAGAAIPSPSWAEDLAQADGDFMIWSADGRYLAFSGYAEDEERKHYDIPVLRVTEPTAGRTFTLTPEGYYYSPYGGGPTWSPDSSQLAVSLQVPPMPAPAVYLAAPRPSVPKQVTAGGALFPSWSPVDNRLAYLEYAPSDPSCGPFPSDRCDVLTLRVHNLDTGADTLLLEDVHLSDEALEHAFAYNAPAWAPDGRNLVVFTGGDHGDLVAVDADTGERRVLAPSVEGGAYAAIAPNAKSVAYVSRSSSNDEIMLVPWDGGEETNLTNNPSSDINPVWSPDGRFIAFLRGSPSGTYRLHILDLIGGEIRPVYGHIVSTRPAWIPRSAP